MRHKRIRMTLATIEGCIGLAALGGGIALLTGVMEHWLPVSFLQGSPFSDYTIPGLVLTFVIGGGMLLAAATQRIQQAWTVLLSGAMGFVMLGWISVETLIIDRYPQAIIPSTVVQQVLLSVLGLVLIGLAGYLWITEYRHRPAL